MGATLILRGRMSALGSISAARRFPTNGRNRRYLAVDGPVGKGPQTTQNRSQNDVKNYWSARSAGAEAVDEIGEADLPGAAQPLGDDDRLHEADAVLDVAIDDDVIVFRPVAHLGGRFGHARGDHLGAVLGAGPEPRFERAGAWRQYEHLDQIVGRGLVELLRPLPVDVGDDVTALGERRLDRRARRAIAMLEHGRVLKQL